MQISENSFNGETDLKDMAALVYAAPTANVHVVDLPYRLSSWAFDEPANTRLWRAANGELLGWAVLQTPFWTIDYAYRPDLGQALQPAILDWADQRAREIVDTPYGHPAWFVAVFPHQTERITALESRGFASQTNVGEDSWSQVVMQQTARVPQPTAPLPEGFKIRLLAGAAETAAYAELHRLAFNSRNMTEAWRSRTLQRPEYVREVDLVLEAPGGSLAAFCVGWLHTDAAGSISGQIEPLGVHPDFRQRGLARAVLTEALWRLQLSGATRLYVMTDNYRDAAFKLYETVGFQVLYTIDLYRKNYG